VQKVRSPYVLAELAKLGIDPRRSSLVTKRVPKPKKIEFDEREPGYDAAMVHIRQVRATDPRPATWFDVRDAYIAGFRAGQLKGPTSNTE
jgi:hypothetical protein